MELNEIKHIVRKNGYVGSCTDLSKKMIGTRDGVLYYNQNFRTDFECKMYELVDYKTKLQQANERINKLEGRLLDTLKQLDVANNYFDKYKELKQQLQQIREYCEKEIEKCKEDTVINRAKPNVRFWRMKDFEEVLEILNSGGAE